MSVESQLNALVREVNELRKDVALLVAASELRPMEESRMASAQAAMRERHQRPTCETCNSVGMVETSAGAIPCEECER